jgi:hypothetical protein
MTDHIAVQRHRSFGAEMAESHFAKFPAAHFTVADLLPLMRGAMGDVAADQGVGSRTLEPYARVAAAGFLRRWRQLAAPDAEGEWKPWPPSDEK